MLTVTLFEPQIPPNTGNIARLCGANYIKLDLVGNIGFDMEDKYLKRAGLDYWKHIDWEYFPNLGIAIERQWQIFPGLSEHVMERNYCVHP